MKKHYVKFKCKLWLWVFVYVHFSFEIFSNLRWITNFNFKASSCRLHWADFPFCFSLFFFRLFFFCISRYFSEGDFQSDRIIFSPFYFDWRLTVAQWFLAKVNVSARLTSSERKRSEMNWRRCAQNNVIREAKLITLSMTSQSFFLRFLFQWLNWIRESNWHTHNFLSLLNMTATDKKNWASKRVIEFWKAINGISVCFSVKQKWHFVDDEDDDICVILSSFLFLLLLRLNKRKKKKKWIENLSVGLARQSQQKDLSFKWSTSLRFYSRYATAFVFFAFCIFFYPECRRRDSGITKRKETQKSARRIN